MRTTIDDITAILDNTSLDDDTIEAYGNSANIFVTNTLTGKGLSEAVLTEIEKWIAAHMIVATRERTIKEAGAGGAYVKYAGDFGEKLNSTAYGQMACILDTSGTLTDMTNGKRSASTFAIPNFD